MQSAQLHLNFDCKLTHWWFVARRKNIAALISHILPPGRPADIVDIGCGTGGNIGSLSGEYTCTGIDQSDEAIELARSRFPQVHFVRGDGFRALRKLAPHAKLILLTDVLEHVADDAAMLARIVGTVRPGTYLLLTVPADHSLWSPHDESHGHYRRYDRHGFESLWAGLPVTTIMLSYFNSRLYPLVKLVRRLNRLRGKSSGAAGTDIRIPAGLLNWVLQRVFLGEGKVLTGLLDGSRRRAYRYGVSLIAVLRREKAEPSIRNRQSPIPNPQSLIPTSAIPLSGSRVASAMPGR
jgi:SAM-dependent methyltransferase